MIHVHVSLEAEVDAPGGTQVPSCARDGIDSPSVEGKSQPWAYPEIDAAPRGDSEMSARFAIADASECRPASACVICQYESARRDDTVRSDPAWIGYRKTDSAHKLVQSAMFVEI